MAMQSLYALLSKSSALSPQNKLIIYNQIIRPVLTYAAPAWCSISDSQMARIQRFQNRILRLVMSADRFARTRDLHDFTNQQLINEYIYDLSNKFYNIKIQNTELTRNITHTRQTDNVKHRPIYSRLPIFFQDRD